MNEKLMEIALDIVFTQKFYLTQPESDLILSECGVKLVPNKKDVVGNRPVAIWAKDYVLTQFLHLDNMVKELSK